MITRRGVFGLIAGIALAPKLLAKSFETNNGGVMLMIYYHTLFNNYSNKEIESGLENVLQQFYLEKNNEYTRRKATIECMNHLNNYMDNPIDQFYVICDETNNPPTVIQKNCLKIDAHIKIYT